MNLGVPEIIIIAIVIFALFGYKKLPDATRAVGRSLRIFKGEMKGLQEDDVATKAEAQTVRAPIEQPAPSAFPQQAVPQQAPAQPAPQAAPAPAPQPSAAPQQATPQAAPGTNPNFQDPTAPPAPYPPASA